MPHRSAFHIMTVAKAVGQFSPFVLSGEGVFWGGLFISSHSFPFLLLLCRLECGS